MTHQEALEIIAKAKPIVLPSSGTTDIKANKTITSFKDLIRNGNSRRKKEFLVCPSMFSVYQRMIDEKKKKKN